MLLGAVGFMMALFYLVNNSDPEIRMYSWQVISSTINIFCAVLIFSASNRLVEHYAFEDIPSEVRHLRAFPVCVDFAHMLFWMMMMLCVLWIAAVCKRKGAAENEDGEESAHRHELDVKCWAMLFAHVAGFAAINCFGDLQQVFFAGSANQSELAVPISASCLLLLCWLAEKAGQYLYKADLKELDDGIFELWEEQTHEAENDIAALCLSFLICQSLRYHTSGQLPDPEGNEPPATRARVLLLCSVLFAFVAVLSVQLTELKVNTIRRRPRSKRVMDIFQLICCMCCAWCSYYGGKRLYCTSFDGDQVVDVMTRIVLSVIFSVLAFGMVLMMNKVIDRQKVCEAKTGGVERRGKAAEEEFIQVQLQTSLQISQLCRQRAVDVFKAGAQLGPRGLQDHHQGYGHFGRLQLGRGLRRLRQQSLREDQDHSTAFGRSFTRCFTRRDDPSCLAFVHRAQLRNEGRIRKNLRPNRSGQHLQ